MGGSKLSIKLNQRCAFVISGAQCQNVWSGVHYQNDFLHSAGEIKVFAKKLLILIDTIIHYFFFFYVFSWFMLLFFDLFQVLLIFLLLTYDVSSRPIKAMKWNQLIRLIILLVFCCFCTLLFTIAKVCKEIHIVLVRSG